MNSNTQDHETYQSINELVTALSEEERTKFADIISLTKLPPEAFEQFCSWSSESYTRNCIVENEKFELILLCWEKGQRTEIHDHGGEECWVKVIQGHLEETLFEVDKTGQPKAIRTTISGTGDISYMIDFMGFHRLENRSLGRGMSLHLYAKPIRNCQFFDENSKTFKRKELSYHTVSEKAVQ